MEDFFNRISHPAMTNLHVDWGGLNVTEVFPSTLPDLFIGRPVILAGRFAGNDDVTVRLNGMAAGQPAQVSIPAPLSTASAAHTGVPAVWAGMKMSELADQSLGSPDPQLPEAIKRVALDYGLISPFTAFVAVDSARRTAGSDGTTVPVAVPVPEGTEYKTTVNEN
jgi:Ca-activated chloride channel family protein